MAPEALKLWIPVLPLAAVLVLAMGCGGFGDGERDDTDVPATVEEAERDEDEEPREEEGEDAREDERPEERSAAVQRILDACREIARRAPGISEERKDELIAECEEAAASDEEALRRATRAACDVLAAAAVPWPVRGPVAEACKQAIPGASPGGSSPY
jgi:hypothetical protein